jgi:hypothetical protein
MNTSGMPHRREVFTRPQKSLHARLPSAVLTTSM